jgi:hypothetical protein
MKPTPVCVRGIRPCVKPKDYMLGDEVHYRVDETCQLHTTRAVMKFVVSLD